MVKSVILRVCAAILSFGMMLVSGVGANDPQEPYDVRDPDACVLNFSVLSDSHVEGNNFARYNVFCAALRDVKHNGSGNDAVIFLGDNTMNGKGFENMLFHGAVEWFLPDEMILPVMGNHDIGNGEGDYEKLRNRWLSYTAAFFGKTLTGPYYCEIIDGYTFIVLGPEGQKVHDMPMSDAQFAFLEDALATAAESGKPAFVFEHFPTDYATDLDLRSDDRLQDILAEYSREHDLFCFVGHTHMPLMSYSFHNDNGYPETYLPRLTELGGQDDNEPNSSTGVGLEVELYENEIVLRGRDFYRGKWEIHSSGDYPGVILEKTYALKNPLNGE